ncbi:MAG: sodium:proton antiporter NhaD [Paludibacteraceae bacterium]|nr:sodium:proton antiporter NhaD [Paludibacteraceae bacterium]
MLAIMIVLFLLGYLAIALEHQISVNKAATALVLCGLLWTLYIVESPSILSNSSEFAEYWKNTPDDIIPFGEKVISYVTGVEIIEHIGDVAEILFFLMGAMTIVELIDIHGGFSIITNRIRLKNKRKLLCAIVIVTFFMSAILDNLTTTIVILMMLRKLIQDQKERWLFAGLVIIAANSGGAFSPIGDVTTIMLWVRGNVSAGSIIPSLILPSIISVLIPLFFASRMLHESEDNVVPVVENKNQKSYATMSYISSKEQKIIFFLGVGSLIFVPIFKSLTHLPPFLGVLLGLSVLWFYTEIMYQKKDIPSGSRVTIPYALSRIDMTTILFFLGILMSVAALQCAGILTSLSETLDNVFNKNVYAINIVIGFLSSIVDNVPLVAGAMGMYEAESVGAFAPDGVFWLMLAYCAGVGGSMLIVGSAAGVVAMGLEKITFGWYLKHISWMAVLGYLAGAVVFVLMH